MIGLLGAWLVRVGLRPLVEVERAASEISDADLERRVPGQGTRTEIGRLATAINRMLDRLQAAFDQREQDIAALQESEARMRQFVADASHELRTPIAATAAYAELFERGARDRPDDLERAMSGIRSETARMADLVEDLLLLAQLDEGRPLAAAPSTSPSSRSTRSTRPTRSPPTGVVRLRIDDVVIVTGDPSRLRQVIDNLLGNVRTHTPPGTVCSVTVRRDGDDARPDRGRRRPGHVARRRRRAPSTASTAPTRRGRGRPVAPASASRSSPRSSTPTTARSSMSSAPGRRHHGDRTAARSPKETP